MITLIRSFIVIFLSLSLLIILRQIDLGQVEAQQLSNSIQNNCIKYNNIKRLIIVSCKSATLTDVYNQINNRDILDKQPQGVWLLNSNLTVKKDQL